MNLRRKLGPLPLWAWLVLALIVGVWLWRRYSSSARGAIVETTPQPVAAGSAQTATGGGSALGAAPSAGSPSDSGAATSDYISALGAQQATLLGALESSQQDVLSLAQSQISALQAQTTTGPFNTQTQPQTSSQPGGSNAPTVIYVSPTAATSSNVPQPTAQVATRSSASGSGGAQPFGGVVSTVKLKNGATLTTYASGRKVEQVPGKTPYVVRA